MTLIMKRLLALSLTVFLASFLALPTTALAAEDPADGAEVTLTTQKDTYAEGEDIQLTLTVRNGYDHPIENLFAAVNEQEFTLLSNTSLPNGETLNAGETKTYRFFLTAGTQGGSERISAILPIVLIVIAAAVIAGIVLLVLRKKNGAKAAISMLLACAMVTSFLAMPVQAQAGGPQRKQLNPSLEITVGDVQKTISLHIIFDHDPSASALQLDLQQMGYREDLDAFVVNEEFSALTGTLKDADSYSSIKLDIYDRFGHLISTQTISAAQRFRFSPVGLLPGLNHIRLTVMGSSILTLELNIYDPYLTHYPQLEDSDTDTDGDGIPDLLENALGMDANNADGDGDGISDYKELSNTLTDPTKADSDGNGLADGDEDLDGDGMTVQEEIQRGLSTVLDDTDRDGISDRDEIHIYGTDPLKSDTDGDGAEDSWELEHGYSPYASNTTFALVCETSGVSEAFPVSASAAVTVSGSKADVTSLEAVRVSAADSPYLSQAIAGYLGNAVDFTLDGTFESATLTFRYDTSLGTIGPDFQPRIYYLNEVTGELEELPNQTVYNGTVIAQTTHFSIYTLLDSTKLKQCFQDSYNAVADCYAGIQEMSTESIAALGSADIVMVMDRSASMAWSDPNSKTHEVARYFVDNMRSGYDNAALLTYTLSTETLCGLTSNTQTLHSAINGVTPDNGVQSDSGTDGANALMNAISVLETGMGSYRYVLFFSDGDDASLQQRLTELVSYANSRRVQLLCVGINTPEDSTLADLAAGTEGKYIILRDNTSVPGAFGDALAVFDAITPTDEDSNNDGISDFLTKLIYDGKIATQNGGSLYAVDFSINAEGQPSDDWDGDGLKNGEEIRLVLQDGSAYMKMKTDPLRVDSDLDGFSDPDELELGMNPMMYSIQSEPLDEIMNLPLFYLDEVAQYDEDYLPEDYRWLTDIRDFFMDLDALIFAGGSSNRKEVYWETMAAYFSNYGQAAMMEDAETDQVVKSILSFTDTVQSVCTPKSVTDVGEALDTATSPLQFIRDAHFVEWKASYPTMDSDALEKLYSEHFTELVGKTMENIPKMKCFEDSFDTFQKLLTTIGKHSDEVDKALKELGVMGDVLTVVETATEVLQVIKTTARINADSEIFLANLTVLEHIIDHSQDEYAVAAAKSICATIGENYWQETGAVISHLMREGLQTGWDALSDFVLPRIPVVGTFVTIAKTVVAATDFLIGISKELESTYKLLTYYEISKAYEAQILAAPADETQWIEFTADTEKRNAWLCSIYGLAQVRSVGETQYVEHYGIITGFIGLDKRDDVKQKVDLHIEVLLDAANAIRECKAFRGPGGGGR